MNDEEIRLSLRKYLLKQASASINEERAVLHKQANKSLDDMTIQEKVAYVQKLAAAPKNDFFSGMGASAFGGRGGRGGSRPIMDRRAPQQSVQRSPQDSYKPATTTPKPTTPKPTTTQQPTGTAPKPAAPKPAAETSRFSQAPPETPATDPYGNDATGSRFSQAPPETPSVDAAGKPVTASGVPDPKAATKPAAAAEPSRFSQAPPETPSTDSAGNAVTASGTPAAPTPAPKNSIPTAPDASTGVVHADALLRNRQTKDNVELNKNTSNQLDQYELMQGDIANLQNSLKNPNLTPEKRQGLENSLRETQEMANTMGEVASSTRLQGGDDGVERREYNAPPEADPTAQPGNWVERQAETEAQAKIDKQNEGLSPDDEAYQEGPKEKRERLRQDENKQKIESQEQAALDAGEDPYKDYRLLGKKKTRYDKMMSAYDNYQKDPKKYSQYKGAVGGFKDRAAAERAARAKIFGGPVKGKAYTQKDMNEFKEREGDQAKVNEAKREAEVRRVHKKGLQKNWDKYTAERDAKAATNTTNVKTTGGKVPRKRRRLT